MFNFYFNKSLNYIKFTNRTRLILMRSYFLKYKISQPKLPEAVDNNKT